MEKIWQGFSALTWPIGMKQILTVSIHIFFPFQFWPFFLSTKIILLHWITNFKNGIVRSLLIYFIKVYNRPKQIFNENLKRKTLNILSEKHFSRRIPSFQFESKLYFIEYKIVLLSNLSFWIFQTNILIFKQLYKQNKLKFCIYMKKE